MLIKKRKCVLLSTLAAVTVSVAVAACGGSSDWVDVEQGTVIENVTVVNTRDGSLTPGHSVVVDNGKIVKIAPASLVRARGAAQTVDATDKYVVPGFVDMHTHAMVRIDSTPTYFPLMLANGITSFREMGEFPGAFPNMVQRARQLNIDSAAGRVDAPEVLLVPSDILQSATSAATAIEQVTQQKALGADFLKVISGNRAAILAYLSESKTQGLHVAGHLSAAVSANESSQLGWKTIEHLGSGVGILLDCSNDEAAIRQALLGDGTAVPAFPSDAATLQRIVDTYSPAKCQALANTFVQNGTWHAPTLRRVRGVDVTDDPALVGDPNLVYVDKTRLALWQTSLQTYAARPAAARAALRQLYTIKLAVTKMMKQSGVKMMAGSDAGRASTWVIPGFGLHEDFHELAAAGLTPLDLLQMATLNPAEFLGRQATMGTVEEGKKADLVLLDANPIEAAANLDKIAGVFLKGRYFSKTALDKLKSDTAAAYAAQPTAAAAALERILASEANHVH